MLQKVRKFIIENQLLIPDKGPVIVGVSGGKDSVALLDILLKSGYQCIVAHCNFHLRGAESDRDQEFVYSLANSLKIPFKTTDFKTVQYAEQHHVSIEMSARDLRYDWFEKIRKIYAAQAIATGHHLDDNIETLLLNLTRGTGLKGLTGIPVRNQNIVRPLLSSSRSEINAYIEKHNLKFVEDSTNTSTDIIRNKFRHEIIPTLENINPSFRDTFKETLKNIQGAYQIFRNEIIRIKEEIVSSCGPTVWIDIQKLTRHREQHTILFEILKEYGFHPDQIKQIIRSLESTSGKLFYSKTHCLLKDREALILRPLTIDRENQSDTNSVENTEEFSIRIFERDDTFTFSKENKIVHLDADKINMPLKIRKWQNTDYFYPLGMKGRKKLSDFFIDLKINRLEKEKKLVLLSDNQIVWIVGLRIDNRFKITAATKRVAEITMLK